MHTKKRIAPATCLEQACGAQAIFQLPYYLSCAERSAAEAMARRWTSRWYGALSFSFKLLINIESTPSLRMHASKLVLVHSRLRFTSCSRLCHHVCEVAVRVAQQLVRRCKFLDAASREHKDAIAVQDGGQTVRNGEHGTGSCSLCQGKGEATEQRRQGSKRLSREAPR